MKEQMVSIKTLHGTGVKQQLTLGLVSVNVQQTFATWGLHTVSGTLGGLY